MKSIGSLGIAVAIVLTSALALAVREPTHLAGRPEIEVGAGIAPVRTMKTVQWNRMPGARQAAWDRFTALEGPNWWVMVNADTQVPERVLGEGVPAPGTVASADA